MKIQDVLELKNESVVTDLRAEVVQIGPTKTGTKKNGDPWSSQGVKLKDQTGEMWCTLWGCEDQGHLMGSRVTVAAVLSEYNGVKSLSTQNSISIKADTGGPVSPPNGPEHEVAPAHQPPTPRAAQGPTGGGDPRQTSIEKQTTLKTFGDLYQGSAATPEEAARWVQDVWALVFGGGVEMPRVPQHVSTGPESVDDDTYGARANH